MRIMTILTGGRTGITALHGSAMDACAVTLGLALVTRAAIDQLGRDVVVRMFLRKVRVTTGAGVGLVRRGGELRGINEQGDFLPGGIRLC